MPNINRDRDIIEHILMYINQIGTAHDDFGASKQRFIESTTYQNAISMCILQRSTREIACSPFNQSLGSVFQKIT